jgi:hypothetical protein
MSPMPCADAPIHCPSPWRSHVACPCGTATRAGQRAGAGATANGRGNVGWCSAQRGGFLLNGYRLSTQALRRRTNSLSLALAFTRGMSLHIISHGRDRVDCRDPLLLGHQSAAVECCHNSTVSRRQSRQHRRLHVTVHLQRALRAKAKKRQAIWSSDRCAPKKTVTGTHLTWSLTGFVGRAGSGSA